MGLGNHCGNNGSGEINLQMVCNKTAGKGKRKKSKTIIILLIIAISIMTLALHNQR
jgi:hypothetical protein